MTPGRRAATLLAIAALATGAAACGDDEEDVEISVPTIDIPTETTAPPTTATGTTTEPAEGTGGGPPIAPDSPSNDVQPPPGTPQAKFEQFCKQNPDACG